jgi:LysR family transcriptional activator of nhaA
MAMRQLFHRKELIVDSWLNYHHLYYFQVIASEGSISKAAIKLRLGQPTLSAQLKQLEEKIGIQLFERHHKKLILTENGKIALEYAAEIFKMGHEMIEVLNDRLVPTRTHVQLGAIDSISKHLILRLVKAAYALGPCSVSILEGKDDELLRELLTHKIDLIFTNHLPLASDEKRIYSRLIAKLPVVICAAPQYKALKKGFPHSMSQKPFVLPTKHSRLRHEVDHYFNVHQIQPDIVGETQDTSLQKIMGTQGIGLIPISDLAVQSLIKKGELINLGYLEGVFDELYLVSCSRKIENPISSQLLKNFQL